MPEIADDIVAVDEAMKLGYNWSHGPFVVDHQPLVSAGNDARCLADHLQDLGIDGVHLGVKFETDHAIAHIPQAGRSVRRQRLRAQFHIGQQLHTFRSLDVVVCAVRAEILEIIGKASSIVAGAYQGLAIYNEGANSTMPRFAPTEKFAPSL